ncbi:hypothetical protein CP533_2769 [Ophiocordyceps camponoti-saundersi (nom. inval.)]|nr:hypothetical protein CP533_2769 [Ophiocordyceps camponoti-saundersi (nom. inval.)]
MALWLYLSAIAAAILALSFSLLTTTNTINASKAISSFLIGGKTHAQHQQLLRNRRICLLIAHPDDEAMFFAPTVLALSRPETGNHVKILCLSTGDAAGLGSLRRRELVRSGVMLGLRGEDDVFVVDNPFHSMTKTWPSEKIASLLASAFTSKASSSKPTIDVLITFDHTGVSSHPNHISLYHGAKAFVERFASDEDATAVDLYALSTVNVLRKYISVFDVFLSVFLSERAVASASMEAEKRVKTKKEGEGEEEVHHPSSLLFVSGWSGFIAARRAMMQAHRSQMVWFRHLYILFSRYMVINDLRLEKRPSSVKRGHASTA